MGFSPDWLALREPADHAARNADLLARARALATPDSIVLDLGSGTGSTARAFGDTGCTWRFVDADAGLLQAAQAQHPKAERVQIDLREIEHLPLEGVRLVTASALLDLMTHDWLTALARRLRGANIPFYAALSYNGIMHWSPSHPDDAAVTDAFNAHQRTDKGIGPALGPDAGEAAADIFAHEGFDVHQANSPWELGPAEALLHGQLVQGIADAAAETGNARALGWGADRLASIAQTAGHIGHIDILAQPQASGG